MKLLTNELVKRFAQMGSQENSANPTVIAKFFDPMGAATWWATEYDPKDKIFFGYVTLFGLGSYEDEWGSFALEELELGIERDLHFTEKPISEIIGRK